MPARQSSHVLGVASSSSHQIRIRLQGFAVSPCTTCAGDTLRVGNGAQQALVTPHADVSHTDPVQRSKHGCVTQPWWARSVERKAKYQELPSKLCTAAYGYAGLSGLLPILLLVCKTAASTSPHLAHKSSQNGLVTSAHQLVGCQQTKADGSAGSYLNRCNHCECMQHPRSLCAVSICQ